MAGVLLIQIRNKWSEDHLFIKMDCTDPLGGALACTEYIVFVVCDRFSWDFACITGVSTITVAIIPARTDIRVLAP